jgi:hypothetical protein
MALSSFLRDLSIEKAPSGAMLFVSVSEGKMVVNGYVIFLDILTWGFTMGSYFAVLL